MQSISKAIMANLHQICIFNEIIFAYKSLQIYLNLLFVLFVFFILMFLFLKQSNYIIMFGVNRPRLSTSFLTSDHVAMIKNHDFNSASSTPDPPPHPARTLSTPLPIQMLNDPHSLNATVCEGLFSKHINKNNERLSFLQRGSSQILISPSRVCRSSDPPPSRAVCD